MDEHSLPPTGPHSPSARNCVSCGRVLNWDTNVCPYCGHDYRFIAAPTVEKRSSMPAIGGILLTLAGVLAVIMAISLILIDASDLDMDYSAFRDSGLTPSDIEEVAEICGVLALVFGAIAILGGAFAFMRKHFALAIVGGVFGMIGMGFLVGALLSLVGLVLIIVAKDEFK